MSKRVQDRKLKQQHYIAGRWVSSEGEVFASENPATSDVLWKGGSAEAGEIDLATAAARKAFLSWSLLDFEARKAFVQGFVEIVKRREEELALAIHLETGKPLWESKTEIATMIGKAGISEKAYQQRTGTQAADNAGMQTLLQHRAIGVFAVLGPYNFPGHLPNGHIIPALLAGNTIVFKPSEFTPMFAELMVQCWIEAGLPDGVLNLVQGGATTGQLLAQSSDINGLLFTGSSKTGHAIHRMFAGQPEKMLALEMGGNNPLLVEQVKDVNAAVYAIIQSAFLSAGQRCTCARRLILLRSAANLELVEKLKSATSNLKAGMEDGSFMGPLINNLAADRVMAFEQSLLERGAIQVLPLHRPIPNRPFINAGIVDVTAMSDPEDEECFGPLLQLVWVDDLDSGIAQANATRYGLSAGLLSDNEATWAFFQQRIKAGIVNWNRPLTGASGAAPFGGIGASGNFRPGAFYAADYSAYPVASIMSSQLTLPDKLAPGVVL